MLFDKEANISLGDLVTFDVLPSLAKFAINVSSWPWASTSSSMDNRKLEMRFNIRPPFSSFERRTDDPVPGLTTFILRRDENGDEETRLRMVDVVELDGELVRFVDNNNKTENDAAVEFDLDVTSSELVVRFGYFERSLFYDPGTIPCFAVG